MSAAVMRREQLDVLVVLAAVDLVLDAVIRKMHLAIEVRLLRLWSCRNSWYSRLILLEDDAADLEIRMLVSEPDFLLVEGRVEIRIVVDLAWATDAGVECLLGPAVALQGVRVEQIASLFGEGQAAFVLTKVDGLDKSFVAEVAKGFVLGVEVMFGDDSERADGGQRAAVLAVQLVHTVAIDNELAFLAARQIEVVNQRVARIVIVSVQLAVDAGGGRRRDPRRRTRADRSIERQAWALLCAQLAPVGLSVKTPWQYLRGVGSGKRRGAGACRRGDWRLVVWNPARGL